MEAEPKYKRVVLKITGEALTLKKNQSFSRQALDFLTREIRSVYQKVELAVVIGGGNIVRGRELTQKFEATSSTADQMGMVATIINSLMLQDMLEKNGLETCVLSSVRIDEFAEPYVVRRAISHLRKGRIIILAAGTGNAGVTTDTAAVFKAHEIRAGIIMKGTKVNGIYDRNPNRYKKSAKFLPKLSYQEFLKKELGEILDQTAVAQARMKRIPILVFNILKAGNLLKAVSGEVAGSLIS